MRRNPGVGFGRPRGRRPTPAAISFRSGWCCTKHWPGGGPFHGKTNLKIMEAVVHRQPEPLSEGILPIVEDGNGNGSGEGHCGALPDNARNGGGYELRELMIGSPHWTRFELLPSSWQCDRTHGRILFSSSSTQRAELYPCRAPSLDTSRTRQGTDAPSCDRSPRWAKTSVIAMTRSRGAVYFTPDIVFPLQYPNPESTEPLLPVRSRPVDDLPRPNH
jgi:hypothetical protein